NYQHPERLTERMDKETEQALLSRQGHRIKQKCREEAARRPDDYQSKEHKNYEDQRMNDRLLESIGAAEAAAATAATAPERRDHRIRKAVALMQAHVSGRITLDEVARSVGLSRPHFFNLFREQMDLTPNVYWNTLRMEEALRQIEASDESLTSVACSLGFTTQ